VAGKVSLGTYLYLLSNEGCLSSFNSRAGGGVA